MIDFSMQNLIWLASKAIKKIGFWGLLGVIIFLVGFILYSSKTSKLIEAFENSKADAEIALLRTEPIDSDMALSQQVPNINQTLPTTKDLPTVLSKINKVAYVEHVALNNGDYKFNKVQDSQINRVQIAKYEVSFPVQGQYVQVRNFISHALFDLPNMSLVNLTFKRENNQIATVEASLMFVIYMKDDALK